MQLHERCTKDKLLANETKFGDKIFATVTVCQITE